MLNLLKDVAAEAAYSVEKAKRQAANFGLKMELFEAEYGGTVLFQGIPISGEDSSTAGALSMGFVRFYIRNELSNGVTSFRWFCSEESAETAKAALEHENRQLTARDGTKITLVKVIGPHALPWHRDARFR